MGEIKGESTKQKEFDRYIHASSEDSSDYGFWYQRGYDECKMAFQGYRTVGELKKICAAMKEEQKK